VKIGKFFTLEELTRTGTKLPNVPNQQQIAALTELVKNVLDPVRVLLNSPIGVNSGFRSAVVNASINGAPNSQHCKGQAADLDTDNNALLFRLIRDNCQFDQLIWERGDEKQPDWVHVSYRADGKNRKEILKFNGKIYLPFK
jgi:hypothetical protein